MIRARATSRRHFLQGLGGAAVAATWSARAVSQAAGLDVAIVGAGAAGLAAARHLQAAGLRVLVLEARDRIGGRAWTDTTSVGVAWDRGCSWLHSSEVNPWVDYARQNGFELARDRRLRHIYQGERRLSGAETTGYRAVSERLGRELAVAGRRGLDIPAEAALTQATLADPWYPMAVADVTAWEGVEPAAFSALDRFRFVERGEDLLIPKGYGTLLAHYGRDVEVRLRTPVRRIRWQGRGVVLDTAAGSLESRVAVVALPSAVIAAGTVEFAPHLPAEVLAAHHDLPLGLMNKVALRFKRNVFPSESGELLRRRRDDGRVMSFQTRLWDNNVCIGSAAGAFAHEIEAAGEAAALEFALAELVQMLGGDVRRQFDRGTATAWAADPWSRGAYSHCLPGRFGARALLTQPVGNRLFFAGEHTEQSAYGTLHGAYLSGLRAAAQVRARLAGPAS